MMSPPVQNPVMFPSFLGLKAEVLMMPSRLSAIQLLITFLTSSLANLCVNHMSPGCLPEYTKHTLCTHLSLCLALSSFIYSHPYSLTSFKSLLRC